MRTKSRLRVKSATKSGATVQISERVFFSFQYVTVTLLVVLGAFHYVYADTNGSEILTKFTGLFTLAREDSIPTSFSILNLLISSILLFAIHLHSKNRDEPIAVYWLILSVIFFVLSIDEGAGIHERLNKLQSLAGVFPMVATHSWVIYGFLFAVAVLVLFVPFLRQLDRRTAALFCLCGAIFLTGALGLEFVGAWMLHNEIASRDDFIWSIRRILEEGCEMYGIAIFNCILFSRIVTKKVTLALTGLP